MELCGLEYVANTHKVYLGPNADGLLLIYKAVAFYFLCKILNIYQCPEWQC